MLTKEELQVLLNDLEAETVERTRAFKKYDKMGEAICAFANDLGNRKKPGHLLLGVEDNGSISGLRISEDDYLSLSCFKTDGNLLPTPSMAIEKFQFPEGDVVVIEVYPSQNTPIRYKGQVWIRTGSMKAIATEDDIHLLEEKRLNYGKRYEEMPCLSAQISDLNLDLFKNQYLPLAIRAEIIEDDKRNVERQLSALRFYDNIRNCPTNLGMILFGKHPEYHIPGSYIQYVRFSGSDKGGDILQEHAFRGPLVGKIAEIDGFINTTLAAIRPIRVTALREKNVAQYPAWACRELVLNAIIHRDYAMGAAPIQVYEYQSGRLEITNSGGLFGQSAEKFPEINDYRNPLLAEAMKVLGYVNKFNRGINKVQSELSENGNPPADFQSISQTVFCVKLYPSEEWIKAGKKKKRKKKDGTDLAEAKTDSTAPNDTVNPKNDTLKEKNVSLNDTLKGKNDTLNDTLKINQRQILDEIKVRPQITQQKLAEKIGLERRQVSRIMKTLQEKGIIRRVGSKKTGHWEII